MKHASLHIQTTALARAFSLMLALSLAGPVLAQDNPAMEKLRSMSDFLVDQLTLHATFDSAIEVLTSDMEKVQFTSSGEMSFQRPDRLRAHRTGGFSDAELVFDGKTATIMDLASKRYATINVSGTVDDLRAVTNAAGHAGLPGVDLLSSDPFALLAADVLQAYEVGQGVIGGVVCDHLFFRNADVDWQLWIASGGEPKPCRLIVTSKTLAGAPQYTLTLTSFEIGKTFGPETFLPTPGGQEVDLGELGALDEVPHAADLQ